MVIKLWLSWSDAAILLIVGLLVDPICLSGVLDKPTILYEIYWVAASFKPSVLMVTLSVGYLTTTNPSICGKHASWACGPRDSVIPCCPTPGLFWGTYRAASHCRRRSSSRRDLPGCPLCIWRHWRGIFCVRLCTILTIFRGLLGSALFASRYSTNSWFSPARTSSNPIL